MDWEELTFIPWCYTGGLWSAVRVRKYWQVKVKEGSLYAQRIKEAFGKIRMEEINVGMSHDLNIGGISFKMTVSKENLSTEWKWTLTEAAWTVIETKYTGIE